VAVNAEPGHCVAVRRRSTVKMKAVISVLVIGAVLAISAQLYSLTRRGGRGVALAAVSPAVPAVMVAGSGSVEPDSQSIKLSSDLSGKLRSVNVEEGQAIHKGQVLAQLENDDYAAHLASAAAEVQEKEAIMRKVVNGAQSRERSQALASEHAAEAVMKNAKENLERRQKLFDAGVISREELERYAKEYNVAKDQYDESSDQYSLINDDAREEDVAIAQANLDLAKARVADAQASYQQTIITSPIDGIVLRVHHRAGESVSAASASSDPVLTVGDTRLLRVRVDIDETDVAKVEVGQKAYIKADAFGDEKFWGRVVEVGELLGPKTARTDEPSERVDRKFLQALVELQPGAHLPVGLRVDSFILASPEQVAVSQ